MRLVQSRYQSVRGGSRREVSITRGVVSRISPQQRGAAWRRDKLNNSGLGSCEALMKSGSSLGRSRNRGRIHTRAAREDDDGANFKPSPDDVKVRMV
jgi:hypothetical protein